MASLNGFLGNALKEDFDIAGTFELPEKRYELSILLSYAMERHPLILKTSKEAEAKEFSLEKEKASISPDITVRGFSDRETDKESYGVSLSIPIPLWYQRRGEIARAFAEKTRAEAEIYKIRVELSRAITEEYQNYLIALDQIDVFEKGLLKQAEEALRIADLSYRLGESGLLEFLDAQRVNRSTLAEYYQSFFELETSIASLERTVGALP
jgi:cobalt-zinc-cadmium efflux system outer membrane protein